MTDVGCFSDPQPLEDHGSYIYQTGGNCQRICLLLQKPVMGLVDGSNCWCGELIPMKKAQVDNSSCDTPCNGFDQNQCGGPSMWWISLTGLTKNRIDNFDPSSISSSTAAPSKTPAPQVSDVASTVVVTATDAPKESKGNSGPNKAGIAAGVVVGVVVLAAIIAGVVFYLRHKKRREVEEEYRRQAAVNSFVGGKLHTSSSSMTDSRLDPEFMARRQSNGSIADNEDYSRRILKVTNPDGN
ncbi:hypothetical protein CC78DRAFT_555787 [Lojkania enalia]|uniref:WSC domain-containing protein n=1 Tax=Lojkania enalia TaxID=147567 RepID=A0A9P4MZ48_9PLEO|nr:hypothetical protein CC78DRAFT_555787 [Didymosphaeria enalia]